MSNSSITDLVSFLGIPRAKQLFNAHISYPRTEELDESNKKLDESIEQFFELSFNSSNFNSILTELKTNIKFKPFGQSILDDILGLLLFIDRCKEDILLSQADNLIIRKGNFSVVKLKNTDDPKSGRSIIFDYGGFKSILECYVTETAKVNLAAWSIIIVGVVLCYIYLFY